MSNILSVIAHYLPTFLWIAFYLFYGVKLRKLPPSMKERYDRHYTPQQTLVYTKCLSVGAMLSFFLVTISMILELLGFRVSSDAVGLFCAVIIIIFSLGLHLYIRLKVK